MAENPEERSRPERDPAEAQQAFEKANRRALEALREIEYMARALREEIMLEMTRGPVMLDDEPRKQFESMKRAIEALAVDISKRGDARGDVPRIPPLTR